MYMQPNIKSSIIKGELPPDHDSVMIVRQVNGIQFFTGTLEELSEKVYIIAQLFSVKSVEILSVAKFQ